MLENNLTDNELAENLFVNVIEEHHVPTINFIFTRVPGLDEYRVAVSNHFYDEHLILPSFYQGMRVTEIDNFVGMLTLL